MKLKWIQRFILRFGALLVLLIGAAALLVVTNVIEFSIPDPVATKYYSWQRLTVFGCSLYLMLYAIYVIFYPGRYYYSDKNFIVQKTEGGDLLISVKAIESLVQQCVDRHEEFKATNLRVIPHKKDGVVVKMKATMPSNISIPLAVANLQKQIKQYVNGASGVQVKNVVVTVDKTSGAMAVSNIEEDMMPKTEEKREEKAVHQRLFEQEKDEAEQPAVSPAEETAAQEPVKEETNE